MVAQIRRQPCAVVVFAFIIMLRPGLVGSVDGLLNGKGLLSFKLFINQIRINIASIPHNLSVRKAEIFDDAGLQRRVIFEIMRFRRFLHGREQAAAQAGANLSFQDSGELRLLPDLILRISD